MNKIKNLEALEALRSQLPTAQFRSGLQTVQDRPQAPVDSSEAQAYGLAFDALLTLWQVVGTSPYSSPPVRRAYLAASMHLQPLLADAMRAAS